MSDDDEGGADHAKVPGTAAGSNREPSAKPKTRDASPIKKGLSSMVALMGSSPRLQRETSQKSLTTADSSQATILKGKFSFGLQKTHK